MSRSAQDRYASAYASEGLLAEQVGVVLQRRLDLRAVEPDGPVDAAVADEDHVVLVRVAAHVLKSHVAEARAALREGRSALEDDRIWRGFELSAERSGATAGQPASRGR